MFSETKVTEIYCMADDFCKEFAKVQEKYMVDDKNRKHRNKPNRMSDAEIMVILILFHSGGFRCFNPNRSLENSASFLREIYCFYGNN